MALMQNARMRFLAIIAIDLTMAASSLVFAVSLRVSGALEPAVVQGLWVAAPLFALIAFGVFNTIGIYRRMWRYTSLRSEEHTSELQSLMRISYAVFCLKKKKQTTPQSTLPSRDKKL